MLKLSKGLLGKNNSVITISPSFIKTSMDVLSKTNSISNSLKTSFNFTVERFGANFSEKSTLPDFVRSRKKCLKACFQ